ncbi:Fic family protein [Streptomyces sp. SLBN-118]|uniref:Fic family protein n=1 Tax=Streptomyces sp. SLBN-118 TaxID=2768454 RepID=UPI00114ECEA0|nr:Fic family protein [Streptomyces sp. SLBN-118]TQK44638.1 Fic family protein [Streptomyces sp. SLBN-118]
MKRPMPPPDADALIAAALQAGPSALSQILQKPGAGPADPYLPWDRLRHKTPPPGLTHEEWWTGIKFTRRQMQRELPLTDASGRPFTFALPDVVLATLEAVGRDTAGQISIEEPVANPATRDRYLISSLIEEAINSSQLEGASTTRRVAKEMLRAGRRPRDRDELMIYNNYQAMRMIGELRDAPLTPELICEIHRVVTDGTLDNPGASGRFQLPGEERIGVFSDTGVLLHTPPAATALPERVERLCHFANGELGDGYIPPVLRAITLHFMIGYDHPFEDGNGRTARALFYWSMLNQGYWLTEFVAISPILKSAPVKYALSYLHTEDDENDLTYFHLHQLEVLRHSVTRLHEYLGRKTHEMRDLQRKITNAPTTFNHRQVALLNHALKNPDAAVTIRSHAGAHNVAYETARQDLTGLEPGGLLIKHRAGKAFTWTAATDLESRLHALMPS